MTRISRQQAAGQLVISFGKDELGLLRLIEEFHTETRVPKAVAVKAILASALLDDRNSDSLVRNIRRFRRAVAPAARRPPILAQ